MVSLFSVLMSLVLSAISSITVLSIGEFFKVTSVSWSNILTTGGIVFGALIVLDFLGLLGKISQKLYGTFTQDELKKFIGLAIIFGFTIGVYWLLRPCKDGIFSKMSGASNIPIAKWASFFFVLPLVMIYSKLVDKFPRQKLFYALCAIYGLLSLAFGYFFLSSTFGLAPQNFVDIVLPNGDVETRHVLIAGRVIGWAWYLFIESFGSIMVALFWAFVADIVTPDSAKRGYGIIAMGAQAGGVLGPSIARQAKTIGAAPMAIIAAIGIFMIALAIKAFVYIIPKDQLAGYKGGSEEKKSKEETGFFEGFKLLLSKPYLLAIFASISIYEIIVTIFDFHLKFMSNSAYSDVASMTGYLGDYAVLTNAVALLCIILGINSIGRKIGLGASLLILPILIAVLVVVLWINPTLQTVFWVMIFAKSINYAFYQPTKEQLYVPTSKDTKYKAKAWTEMFGGRSSKAFGSGINLMKKFATPSMFITLSSLASLGLIGIWAVCAIYLGKTHKKAVSENKIVC